MLSNLNSFYLFPGCSDGAEFQPADRQFCPACEAQRLYALLNQRAPLVGVFTIIGTLANERLDDRLNEVSIIKLS